MSRFRPPLSSGEALAPPRAPVKQLEILHSRVRQPGPVVEWTIPPAGASSVGTLLTKLMGVYILMHVIPWAELFILVAHIDLKTTLLVGLVLSFGVLFSGQIGQFWKLPVAKWWMVLLMLMVAASLVGRYPGRSLRLDLTVRAAVSHISLPDLRGRTDRHASAPVAGLGRVERGASHPADHALRTILGRAPYDSRRVSREPERLGADSIGIRPPDDVLYLFAAIGPALYSPGPAASHYLLHSTNGIAGELRHPLDRRTCRDYSCSTKSQTDVLGSKPVHCDRDGVPCTGFDAASTDYDLCQSGTGLQPKR